MLPLSAAAIKGEADAMIDRARVLSHCLMLASACVMLSACPRFERYCDQKQGCPEGEVCSDGTCIEAPACDGGACQTQVSKCPAEPPADPSIVFASVNLRCEYGKECCCGACYPSQICIADAGDSFACLNTDSCLVQSCDECAADADCGSGQVCEANRDAQLVCVDGCREDQDCGGTKKCKQVHCLTVPCPRTCLPR